jgi:Zn-dependent metalloprotease
LIKPTALKSAAIDPVSACFSYLTRIKSLLKSDHPEEQFAITWVHADKFTKTHIRLNQVYKGIPVYGGDIVVHLNETGDGESFNGRYFPISGEINTVPALQPDAAIESALLHLYKGSRPENREPMIPFLASKEKNESSLVIYRKKDNPSQSVLAYHVTLFEVNHHRWEYFIDATSGQVLHYYENTCTVDGKRTSAATDLNDVTRTMNSYEYGSDFYLIDLSRNMYTSSAFVAPDELQGAIITLDMKNTYGTDQKIYYVTSSDNSWTNSTAVSAHYNAGTAYDVFKCTQRNSIDGNKEILLIINVPDEETIGGLDNAFWNRRYMFY